MVVTRSASCPAAPGQLLGRPFVCQLNRSFRTNCYEGPRGLTAKRCSIQVTVRITAATVPSDAKELVRKNVVVLIFPKAAFLS